MSAHEGVSCDACGKSNFRSKRYKCLICYDYDLCSTCYQQGEASSHHTAEHPMQCILTRQDFDLYYHGERCTSEQPQSLTCPFCGEMGFALPFVNDSGTQQLDLFHHLQLKHGDEQQSNEIICPICAAMSNGEPNLVTADLISHIANDHQHQQLHTPSSSGGPGAYSRQSSSGRDFDFSSAAGVRGGFRRGPLRTPSRRGGRGGGPVSQHFVVDTSAGVSGVGGGGGGSDPIADLLTQLSTVRRLAAANSNGSSNSLAPPSNTINLQTLTRQQYERERLRSTLRAHHHHQSHHHHHQQHQQQQSTSSSNNGVPAESDFFDSLFSSALFIDPAASSSSAHQTWAQIVAQQQQQQQHTPEQAPPPPPPPPPPQQQQQSSTKTSAGTEPDPSLLRRLCDDSSSSSSSSTQLCSTAVQQQQQKRKNDFVQGLLLASFACSMNENEK